MFSRELIYKKILKIFRKTTYLALVFIKRPDIKILNKLHRFFPLAAVFLLVLSYYYLPAVVPKVSAGAPAAPAFTSVPAESSDPINYGQTETFSGTATDSNGDAWWLAICKTNAVSGNKAAAPTCTGGAYCVSASSAASGSQNTCGWVTDTAGANTWYGFACDGSNSALCSSNSNANSPLTVNVVAPTIQTHDATGTTATATTLNATTTSTGGGNLTVRGFAISNTSSSLLSGVSTTTESGSFGTGDFYYSTTTLSCGTQYWFRAYGTNSAGTSYGSILNFTTSVCSSISVSGSLYSDEGAIPITSGKTIKVAVATSTPGVFTATSDGSGNWTLNLTGTTVMAIGQPVVAWVSGSIWASAVTKASSTSNNITGLDLYQNRVIVKHEGFTGTSTTYADMSVYNASNDSNIRFTANSNAINILSGSALYVAPGSEFSPGSGITVTTNSSSSAAFPSGDFKLASGNRQDGVATSSILTLGGAMSVAGSWYASSTSDLNHGNQTVTLTATSTGKSIIATSSPFYALTFNGTNGGWTFQDNATTTNDFTITNGAVTAPGSGKSLYIGGNYSNSGTFTHNSGNVFFNGGSAQTISGNTIFNNVDFSGAGTKSLSAANATTTDFTIQSTSGAVTAPGSAYSLYVSGNFSNSGTFTHNSGDVVLTGASKTITGGSATFNNLQISGTITTTDNFTVAGLLTVDSTKTLTINASNYLTSSSAGTFSITNGTITGAGTLVVQNSALPTDGTLSSRVRLDATNGDITMPARTYGGVVEPYNSGATNRQVNMGSGIFTFSSALQPTANGTGNITLNAASNNPTASITGNLAYSGTGGGQEIIWTGTGTWTASGSTINFTGGTFTASSTNSFIMNGSGTTLTSSQQAFASTTFSGTITLADMASSTGNVLLSGTINGQTYPLDLTGSSKTLQGGGTVGALQVNGSYTLGTADLTVGSTTIASGGTLTINSGRYYTSTSSLTVNGTLAGTGTTTIQHSNLTTGGTLSSNARFDSSSASITIPARTFGANVEILTGANPISASNSNATTTGNFFISSGAFTAPGSGKSLYIGGNYSNSGTFTANSGKVFLNGSSQQILSGTMTGSNAFYNLEITNISGGGDATNSPSVIFNNSASTTATFTLGTGGTTARFATTTNAYTFQNINWLGASGNVIKLRSDYGSGTHTQWKLKVPGTKQSVSYIDFMDTDASYSSNSAIDASGGTNVNSGNNTNITFVTPQPTISSAANQTFEYVGASTANSQITVGVNANGAITAANGLRIAIATSTVKMLWDTTKTSPTYGGTMAGYVNSTTYEGGGSVLAIGLTQDFTTTDTLTISNAAFTTFSGVNAATAGLKVFKDGPNDIVSDATDDKTVTIKGKITQSNPDTQQSNQFTTGVSLTNTPLFDFKLAPAAESASISQIVVSLSNINGFSSGDISNAYIYVDYNGNGTVDANDTAYNTSAVTASISGSSGTMTFASSTYATTTSQNYILQANVSNIGGSNQVTFNLNPSDVTATGGTSLVSIGTYGFSSSAYHVRTSGVGGGGGGSEMIGGAPPSVATTTGGGQGGGAPAGGETPPLAATTTGGGQGGGELIYLPPIKNIFSGIYGGLANILNGLLSIF